jgi:hypothetical protein
MEKIITYICLVTAFFATLSGCRELEIDKYENDPRLYFYRDINLSKQRDSISYSFFIQDAGVTRDTVLIELRTMGIPSTGKRPFKVEQSNAGDSLAAEAGVHYLPFDSDEMKGLMQVEPGAIDAFLPVVLLRDASLKNKEVRLEITIAENENFKPGIQNNLKFVVKSSDFAVEPASWQSWSYFFGEWGPQKMLFLMKYLELDFNQPSPQEIDIFYYYSGLARDLLKQYNDAHPNDPLTEDDGTLVSFD